MEFTSLEELGDYVRGLVEERPEESLSSRGDQRRAERADHKGGSIFRVSEHIRATDLGAYEPKVISIGPYHRNKPHLGEMNQVKLQYLRRYLQRHQGQAVPLRDYVCHIKDQLMARSRLCYFGGLSEMGPSELSTMLLLDGCFIVELLLRDHDNKRVYNPGVDPGLDLILGNSSTRTLVEYDLLLLENQLPFFVLDSLYKLGALSDEENPMSLANHFVNFFTDYLPPHCTPPPPPHANFYHLLHIFHSCITADDPPAGTSRTKQASVRILGRKIDVSSYFHGDTDRGRMVSKLMIPCMTDLVSAQVRFKRKDDWNYCNVSIRNGVMEIASLQLNRHSSCWYRNLIAFEQHFPAEKSQVTAYAMFLGCLIESEKDLAELRQVQVAASSLDSHDAAVFFRKLCRDTIVDYNKTCLSNLTEISTEVRKCYGNNMQQWVAALKTLYLANPKEFINLVYGVFLVLLLTGIQTFYTVYAYHRPPK